MPPKNNKNKKNNAAGSMLINRMKKTRSRITPTGDARHVHIEKVESNARVKDSVTEPSQIDSLLEKKYNTAARVMEEQSSSVLLLTEAASCGIFTKEERTAIDRLHDNHRQYLRIPRKPKWSRADTKKSLEEKITFSFYEWQRQLCELQKNNQLNLTPFERNVEVWKQLWSVVERSHVLVQIIDGRNPLMFRCTDLEVYAKEHDKRKVNLLIINKSDYLSEEQREAWAQYFRENNIYAVFFSAMMSGAMNENLTDQVLSPIAEHENNEQERCQLEDEELNNNKDASNITAPPELDDDTNEVCNEELDGDTSYASSDGNYLTANDNSQDSCDNDSVSGDNGSLDGDISNISSSSVSDHCPSGRVTSSKIYNREELIELLTYMCPERRNSAEKTTIGLVGYPNVGKSSTINCLLQKKRVNVSATPGKTKHFQTHMLNELTELCDCPGLVFPAFVHSRQEMILWGILPIDRARLDKTVIDLICSMIPPAALEASFSIKLPGDHTRNVTTEEFLSVYALSRGYMSKNRPETSRAARDIMKEFLNGRLLHCVAPPGVDQSKYHVHNTVMKCKSVKLTPQQQVFMPDTPESIETHIQEMIHGIQLNDQEENSGTKPRKHRLKKPKGKVELKENENGELEAHPTKKWRNVPKKVRTGKKNANTNDPYSSSLW